MVYHQKDSPAQNFIKHPRLVSEMLAVSDIKQTDLVLEIGPGKGIITEQLCRRALKVVAVEKDKELAESLKIKFGGQKNVEIVEGDFLEYRLPEEKYKVFANIPFSITAEIMNKFLKSTTMPVEMYLIMQLEVAEKFMGSPHESQSSILTKPWYEVEIMGDIDRTNFLFKPQVKIVLVKFAKRSVPFVKDELKKEFRDFVIFGFNQWKETWIEAYKNVFSFKQLDTLKKIHKIEGLKPGQVNFDTWLHLFKSYDKIANQQQKSVVSAWVRKMK